MAHPLYRSPQPPWFRRAGCLAVGSMLLAGAVSAAPLARETRPIAAVTRIVLRAPGELSVTQGASDQLELEAEPRVLARLRTPVQDGVLHIKTDAKGFSTDQPVRYRVRLRTLTGIESHDAAQINLGRFTTSALDLVLAGSGRLDVAGLTARRLSVCLPGSAEVHIGAGAVETSQLDISGSGQYAAPKLTAEHATVSISGSGEALVAARRSLDVTIDGSGEVCYLGHPHVTQTITGAGSVNPQASCRADESD